MDSYVLGIFENQLPYFFITGSLFLSAFLTATVASAKGRAFWLWLIIGFVSPVIGLITVAFMPDVRDLDPALKAKHQRSWVIFACLMIFVSVVYIVATIQMAKLTGG